MIVPGQAVMEADRPPSPDVYLLVKRMLSVEVFVKETVPSTTASSVRVAGS